MSLAASLPGGNEAAGCLNEPEGSFKRLECSADGPQRGSSGPRRIGGGADVVRVLGAEDGLVPDGAESECAERQEGQLTLAHGLVPSSMDARRHQERLTARFEPRYIITYLSIKHNNYYDTSRSLRMGCAPSGTN